jgi:hypothetical protein
MMGRWRARSNERGYRAPMAGTDSQSVDITPIDLGKLDLRRPEPQFNKRITGHSKSRCDRGDSIYHHERHRDRWYSYSASGA